MQTHRRQVEIVMSGNANWSILHDKELQKAIGYLSIAFFNFKAVIFIAEVQLDNKGRPEHEITATYYDEAGNHKYTIGGIRRHGETEYEFHS